MICWYVDSFLYLKSVTSSPHSSDQQILIHGIPFDSYSFLENQNFERKLQEITVYMKERERKQREKGILWILTGKKQSENDSDFPF